MIAGCDYASVDGNASPDFHKAYASGIRFVIIRKSEHVFPDPHYSRDAQHARDAGLVVGAYHFPSFGLRAASPATQVAAFKSASGSIFPQVDLPPCLDVEFPGGVAATGRSHADILNLLNQFVLEIEEQVGCSPLVYTSQNQVYDLGFPTLPWASRCPLFVKTAYVVPARHAPFTGTVATPHSGARADDPHDYYRIPDPWSSTGWHLQEYQGDALGVPGFSSTVDPDRFQVAQQGDTGPHIAWLRVKLNLPVGDVFDDTLGAAIRSTQAAQGLLVDGIVGPRTFAAIAWKSP